MTGTIITGPWDGIQTRNEKWLEIIDGDTELRIYEPPGPHN